MMSSVITTDFERWKAQEAALGKPVALNEFVFANVPGLDPSKDISRDEKLPPAGQIVHRQAINKAGLASENAVAYSVTLGTDVGDFVFNWIGLINKESGTLAMITHAPEQRKIKTVDGVQGNVLTRSFLLEFNGAATETQITTSAETWQIDFTARLAGMDEIQRLANRDIYGAAVFFGDGFLVTKAAEQYRVTPGTAYIEGLRGTLEEITAFNNLRDTKIYADFTFQGNLVSKWQTFVKVTTAKTLAHYQDAAGFQHYVAVIAEIDQNGNITDKRVKGTAIDRELAELKESLPNDYATKPEVNGKLAKAKNGADIPDTEAFIKNLGLGDTDGFVGRLIKTRVFTSSGTYTPTPGTKRIRVTITGGGGGGGGCQAHASNETFFGAGGGAGGTIISIMTAGSYYVVIGAGGSGGAGALNGLNGGDSSFASLIAPGGAGGGKSGVSNTNGGAGGVPNTGDIRIIGGHGGDGQAGNFSVSGGGGASHWGGGGRAGADAGGGISGRAYGSGGGGAYDPAYSGTKMTGGNGAAGICIIEEFA
ncbi:phage tail protein [Morganella morganii]